MSQPIIFSKATKHDTHIKAAIFGPSGAGKTYTSLRIAGGIDKMIGNKGTALIDTEARSASKYADRFDFDTIDLAEPTPENYALAIRAAESAGYGVLIIDSLSHGWEELLAEVDRLAASNKNNRFNPWSKITPRQREFVKALLGAKIHIIATMRSKTEWTINTDARGRMSPTRLGLKPNQGKDIEYEFDMLLQMDTAHSITVIKDRSSIFQDRDIAEPGESFGEELVKWLCQTRVDRLAQSNASADAAMGKPSPPSPPAPPPKAAKPKQPPPPTLKLAGGPPSPPPLPRTPPQTNT